MRIIRENDADEFPSRCGAKENNYRTRPPTIHSEPVIHIIPGENTKSCRTAKGKRRKETNYSLCFITGEKCLHMKKKKALSSKYILFENTEVCESALPGSDDRIYPIYGNHTEGICTK